ncbi:hypothetical protein N7467_006185 [Penicillium canescens]|nr:hypothetical protein N7467_006185 [Penicillium canescens]
MAIKADPSDTKFTVFIRLPFARGDFVDPPPVEWDAYKDQALWDILSRPSKGDIDWKALAENFEVTLQFLLQQAAWLYDRQLSQVRAQIRKVGTTQSISPSPAPGSVSGSTALGGQVQKDVPVTGPRGATRQGSQQKDIPRRSLDDRRTSTPTTAGTQQRGPQDPTRTDTPTAEEKDSHWDSLGRHPSVARREQPPAPVLRSPPLEEEDLSSSLSEESDSDEETSRRMPRFKRFGKFSTQRSGLRDDEDDEDDTPAFLPLVRENEQTQRERPAQELSATLRLGAERAAQRRRGPERPGPIMPATDSSTSSMSSGAPVSLSPSDSRRMNPTAPTLNTQRLPESRQNSRKSTASGRETSDGTPSMGSSFSDLDDASVTQSALEEALLSNMQHGGMASRMSTISQALRSRYLQ